MKQFTSKHKSINWRGLSKISNSVLMTLINQSLEADFEESLDGVYWLSKAYQFNICFFEYLSKRNQTLNQRNFHNIKNFEYLIRQKAIYPCLNQYLKIINGVDYDKVTKSFYLQDLEVARKNHKHIVNLFYLCLRRVSIEAIVVNSLEKEKIKRIFKVSKIPKKKLVLL